MPRVVVALLLLLPAAAGAQPPEDANGAGRLIHDIAIDYKNFLSLHTAEWLGVGGVAAAAVHVADDWFYEQTQGPQPLAATVPQHYGDLSGQVPLAVGWWLAGHAMHSARGAAAGRDLVRAQISAFSWTYALKFAVNRDRPNGDPRSFPSGHASATFATAMVLQQHYGWKLGVPMFVAASYTAASRVIDNKHWASDVVFGASVGMASARTVTVRLRDTPVSLVPIALRGGGGILAEVRK